MLTSLHERTIVDNVGGKFIYRRVSISWLTRLRCVLRMGKLLASITYLDSYNVLRPSLSLGQQLCRLLQLWLFHSLPILRRRRMYIPRHYGHEAGLALHQSSTLGAYDIHLTFLVVLTLFLSG